MDIHELGDVTAEDVAKAHVADLEAQEKYGVNYLKYWVNENCGKVFCLVEAPDRETAARVADRQPDFRSVPRHTHKR